MAQVSGAAARYAEAIFQVARDTENFAAWDTELAQVAGLVESPQAAPALTSPAIPSAQKSGILSEALPSLSDQMKRFVGLMLQRGRLGDVPDVLREFRVLVDEYHGVQIAEVVSASPLDDAQRQLISSRLAAEVGSRVRLDERVDPDIIGGVIARVGDRVFDGSVRGRLERLRRTLAGSAR